MAIDHWSLRKAESQRREGHSRVDTCGCSLPPGDLEQRKATQSTILDEMEELVLQEVSAQRLQFLQQQDQLFELENQINDLNEQANDSSFSRKVCSFKVVNRLMEMRNRLSQAELQPVPECFGDLWLGWCLIQRPSLKAFLLLESASFRSASTGSLCVFVPNKDIGFIKPGQEAEVRVDAFPFTRYGELPGSVTDRSRCTAGPHNELLPFSRKARSAEIIS